MSIPAYLRPENGLPGRALGTWLDHAPQGVASRFVVMWFVILYTAFGIIASGALGLPPELLETYARGQHLAAGYAGHAPLAPWIAGVWFRLFPPIDWAFHLLAVVNAAVGLFAADRIARQYLSGDKQIAVLLLLLLTPFWQFCGQGFGAAETMLSAWPVATWCFLRAFATRNVAWSAAAGVAAALAVLGNDAAVFLIAGFIVAVLAHPGRGVFLRSWAPWVALAAGLAALAPHLQWLYATGLAAPDGVTGVETAVPLADALRDSVVAIALSVAAVVAVLASWWLAVRPGRDVLRDTVWPADADGRMLVILLAVPLVLQFVMQFLAAPLSWGPSSTWFLLPVVLLRPKGAAFTRTAAIRITALVVAATVAALAAAPLLAWRRHNEGTAEGREYYPLLGTQVTKAWRLAAGQPLQTVTGDPRLAAAVAFYSPDRPLAAPGFEARPEGGYAAVCRTDDEACVAAAKQQAAGNNNVQFITYSTVSHYLGKPSRLERFFFILALPPGSKPPGIQLPGIDVR